MKKIIPIAMVVVFGIMLFVFSSKPKPEKQAHGIINAHEHIQSIKGVPKFLKAMEKVGVVKTLVVGSPEATILLGREGFFGEKKYNDSALDIAKKYPDQFIFFPTLDPKDPDKLEKLKHYIAEGGQGLKLYSGHTFFYELPLDDPGMMEVYAYCEQNQLPILFHVNTGHYLEAFEKILKTHPKLKVVCPHFCLSTIKHSRFRYLMDTYPNLYTDFSFGFLEFLNPALLRISRARDTYRQLFIDYQDRILFGTDMVITDANYKTVEWLANVAQVYRDLLELDRYTFFGLPGMTLRGFALNEAILEKIYFKNFERFMAKEA